MVVVAVVAPALVTVAVGLGVFAALVWFALRASKGGDYYELNRNDRFLKPRDDYKLTRNDRFDQDPPAE